MGDWDGIAATPALTKGSFNPSSKLLCKSGKGNMIDDTPRFLQKTNRPTTSLVCFLTLVAKCHVWWKNRVIPLQLSRFDHFMVVDSPYGRYWWPCFTCHNRSSRSSAFLSPVPVNFNISDTPTSYIAIPWNIFKPAIKSETTVSKKKNKSKTFEIHRNIQKSDLFFPHLYVTFLLGLRADALGGELPNQLFGAVLRIIAGGALFCGGWTMHFRRREWVKCEMSWYVERQETWIYIDIYINIYHIFNI